MKAIKLDISKSGFTVPAEMQQKALEANRLLHTKQGAGNDFLGWVNLLEAGTAIHSSILVETRIPWTEEPGRLQSQSHT